MHDLPRSLTFVTDCSGNASLRNIRLAALVHPVPHIAGASNRQLLSLKSCNKHEEGDITQDTSKEPEWLPIVQVTTHAVR